MLVIAAVVSALDVDLTSRCTRPAAHGPFALRARLLTPLADGGTRHEADGLLVVDGGGRIDVRRGRVRERPEAAAAATGPAAVGRPARAWSTSTPTCRSSRTPAWAPAWTC